jgi:hypothetical protein
LATIGYGDTYPHRVLGKICGAITSSAGIGLIAMPTGILVFRSRRFTQPFVAGRVPAIHEARDKLCANFEDARHKAGHERPGEVNHLNASEH